jgi:hypothetical protein
MTIGLKGLFTPGGDETRDIMYLDVEYNGNNYEWAIYRPMDSGDIGEYIAANETSIYAEIAFKEAKWAALDPKTREIGGEQVPIPKSEIVTPDVPDYYALRRKEYPSIGDQLGAIAKGINSPEYQNILAQIEAVKQKYPKPQY